MSKSRLPSNPHPQDDDEVNLLETSINQMGVEDEQSPSKDSHISSFISKLLYFKNSH